MELIVNHLWRNCYLWISGERQMTIRLDVIDNLVPASVVDCGYGPGLRITCTSPRWLRMSPGTFDSFMWGSKEELAYRTSVVFLWCPFLSEMENGRHLTYSSTSESSKCRHVTFTVPFTVRVKTKRSKVIINKYGLTG